MKRAIPALILSASLVACAAMAADSVNVGGQPMLPSKDIVDNAVNSADHTTLVAAVKAAGLVDTLKGAGPFTVFAPTNAAFGKLPPGTVETLVKPESKAALTQVLTYHVVPGRYDFDAMAKGVQSSGKGVLELKTVNGAPLWVMANGKHNLTLKDGKGNTSTISTYDVYQSNGVINVIDTVLMPR